MVLLTTKLLEAPRHTRQSGSWETISPSAAWFCMLHYTVHALSRSTLQFVRDGVGVGGGGGGGVLHAA